MISTSGLAPSTSVPPTFWPLKSRVLLAIDLGVERGQVVVLGLRPALERVVVALVAVEAHGQEQLRRVLHRRVRLAEDLVVAGRRVVEVRPRPRQDGVGELVVGHVVGDGLVDPVVVGLRSLHAEELAIHVEQVGPFVGPVIDVFGASDELVHQLVALDALRPGVGEEGADLVRLRRQAGQIESDAADELGVGADAAGQLLDQPQLVVDQRVDVVVRLHVLPAVAAAVAHDDDARSGVGAFVAGQDRRFAAADGRGRALAADRGHLVIAAVQERLGRHVAHLAVGERGVDGHLLFHPRQRDDAAFREDLDLGHARAIHVELDALGDPQTEQFVIRLAGVHEGAADVRHLAGRLEQHQARVRGGAVEAAACQVVGQRTVVEDGVVAAERQFETVLAVGAAVAGAGVAADARHGRHHVADETDLIFVFLPRHLDRDDRRLAGQGELEDAVAVGRRPHQHGGTHLHVGRLVQLGHPRHVDPLAGVQHTGQHDLGVLERIGEGDAGRLGLDLDEPGAGRQRFLRLVGAGGGSAEDGGQDRGGRERSSQKRVFHSHDAAISGEQG